MTGTGTLGELIPLALLLGMTYEGLGRWQGRAGRWKEAVAVPRGSVWPDPAWVRNWDAAALGGLE